MQKDYRGYLVMFGNTQLPNSFLTRYRSTPDQRIEKKAGRDNNESLQRVTSPNFKTTLNLELRPLSQREKDLFNSIKSNGLQDATQKKYRVTYWNLDTCVYGTGSFYIPDTEFAIDHIADNDIGEMYYEKVTIEMIQY